MAKRAATRQLNHDNWDEEEEEEDLGSYQQQASSETLKGRVIKQARRKLNAGNEGEGKKNVFSGFAGFGVKTTPAANAFNINFAAKPPTVEASKIENGEIKQPDNGTNEKEYLAGLRVLNETVTTWIADHVKKNPCCVLTPIFQDYEKHLKDLDSKRSSSKENKTGEATNAINTFKNDNDDKKFQFGAASVEPSKPSLNFFGNGSTPAKSMFAFNAATSTPVVPASTFSFGAVKSEPEKTTPSSTFSFGAVKKEPETTTPSSTFSFNAVSSTTTSPPAATPLFSFSTTTKPAASTPAAPPFSFGLASNKPSAATEEKKEEAEGDGEEDEDAPPKVEIKQVQEDDAFYSIRCKLFYKKDNNYTEKGVGMLHLKKVNDDKTQLVIRADTSLGIILLNIILNPQLTTQRVGKNNVMLVCIPNPPIDPKTPPAPTPMLLRVKTDTEADELLAKLNDAKK